MVAIFALMALGAGCSDAASPSDGPTEEELRAEAQAEADRRNAEQVDPAGPDELAFCGETAEKQPQHICKPASANRQPCVWDVGNAEDDSPTPKCFCFLLEEQAEETRQRLCE